MQKCGFSQTRILPYKNRIVDPVLIQENISQWIPAFSHVLCSATSSQIHTYSYSYFPEIGYREISKFVIWFHRILMWRCKAVFFYLSSKISKYIQSAGLKEKYNKDAKFALHLHMLTALAFFFESNFIQYFKQLCDNIQHIYADDFEEV